MTEERINELEEYEQNSPKVNNREKTGPPTQKKKKKAEQNLSNLQEN